MFPIALAVLAAPSHGGGLCRHVVEIGLETVAAVTDGLLLELHSHRVDLVAHPLLGLVPMVRVQDSVSSSEFELVSPALCDADVDRRLTVGGRAEEEGGFQCGIVSLPMSLHWLSWGSIQFRAFSWFRPVLLANTD